MKKKELELLKKSQLFNIIHPISEHLGFMDLSEWKLLESRLQPSKNGYVVSELEYQEVRDFITRHFSWEFDLVYSIQHKKDLPLFECILNEKSKLILTILFNEHKTILYPINSKEAINIIENLILPYNKKVA